MSYTQNFIKTVFNFNRRDFFLLIGLNLSLGIAFSLLPVHEFIQGVLIVFMFFKTVTFTGSSVLPSLNSHADQFSWKYLMGLPLNKKELIHSLILSHSLALVPLFIWILSFHHQIGSVFSDETTPLVRKVQWFLIFLPLVFFISISSIKNIILAPRRQYSRLDSKTKFYQGVKVAVIWVTGAFYFLYFAYALAEAGYFLGFYKILGESIGYAVKNYRLWMTIPLMILALFFQYKRIFVCWKDETIGYVKNSWNTRRDFSIISLCLCLNMGLAYHIDLGTPREYSGTTLIRSVYKGDMKRIRELLKEGHDINEKNDHGYSALMVAARHNRNVIYNFLKSKDAKLEGHTKDFGFNILHLAVRSRNEEVVRDLLQSGFNLTDEQVGKTQVSPLHLAARECNGKILDLLIDKKPSINIQNNDGETPLHYAAKAGCFSSVLSLLEAGADPLIKNKKGHAPLEVMNKSNRYAELRYYLEKRTRAPAGKGTP